ncbi:uncharacterized protein LOC129305451 [Prosopis cineraria]|uniref:uncharacterized protein LOC129305451 n=1 Tax=Prosopis cineraria TaxID=364024 RepID=UPI00240EA1C0|nr:uncharacterized protein LOC129305451 [Prosopis cineraria]
MVMDHLFDLQSHGESPRSGFPELRWSLTKHTMMMKIKWIKISFSIMACVELCLSNQRYTKDQSGNGLRRAKEVESKPGEVYARFLTQELIQGFLMQPNLKY